MFKKIKENEYIKKIIELWNVPRYRSLLILGIYIIFFAFVIAFIKNGKSMSINNTDEIDIMTIYEQMNNYRYQATIKGENKDKIVGRVNENKQIIMFYDKNYYYNNVHLYRQEDNVYKQTDEILLDFEIWRMTPTFISDLIKKGTFDSKTEYADGKIANTYLVNLGDFIKLYFGDETETDEVMRFTIIQDNKRIFKVELDLTPIYHQQQFSSQPDYIVWIEYDMIDQINPIIVNIESSE